MDPTSRALALVSRAKATTTPGQAQFATRVAEVLQTHQDIASEACWQELARVIAECWLVLGHEQAPVATWQMLTRCTETVLKLRRGQRQGTGDGGEAALEEFRAFMRDVVTGEDTGQG